MDFVEPKLENHIDSGPQKEGKLLTDHFGNLEMYLWLQNFLGSDDV